MSRLAAVLGDSVQSQFSLIGLTLREIGPWRGGVAIFQTDPTLAYLLLRFMNMPDCLTHLADGSKP